MIKLSLIMQHYRSAVGIPCMESLDDEISEAAQRRVGRGFQDNRECTEKEGGARGGFLGFIQSGLRLVTAGDDAVTLTFEDNAG